MAVNPVRAGQDAERYSQRKLHLTSYVITNHAREEMAIRGIAEPVLDAVMRSPGQIVPVRDGLIAYQSVVSTDSGGDALIRVIVTEGEPPATAGGDGLPDKQDREILEDMMKVRYDPETDTLTLRLSDQPVSESDEAKPGVILDFDKAGNVVGIEILKASTVGVIPQSIEYAYGAA